MIEHLHNRQRIADFVRDLRRQQAQRGELFILAQLLFHIHHPLVEPGLLDGNGGQFGQGREDANLLIGEAVRQAGIDAERADGLAA